MNKISVQGVSHGGKTFNPTLPFVRSFARLRIPFEEIGFNARFTLSGTNKEREKHREKGKDKDKKRDRKIERKRESKASEIPRYQIVTLLLIFGL